MWKDYSKSYIKNNRASSISIIEAAFVATMFLSLLVSIAYNFWAYEIEKIILEEGGWQGRIICENFNEDDLSDSKLSLVRQFANAEKTAINEEASEHGETVVDVYFQNVRAIYQDMPLVSALTVLFSAWLPARKLSKMTPLEAIQNAGSLALKKKKHSRILSALFGMKGEMAGNVFYQY